MTTTPDLRIYVTARDIREGIPRDPEECPVARATARAIKRVMKVDPEWVTVIHNIVAHVHITASQTCTFECFSRWWVTSSALVEYIGDFDRGLPVKQASFILKGRSDP